MTNAFLKRVDTLTDWHNRFPDANVDLLAELVLDVWNKAEEHTEQRIIKLLEDKSNEPCCCFTGTFGEHELPDVIALIKGENK